MIRRFNAVFALLAGLSAASTPALRAVSAPPGTATFPAQMQSFPLYGDATIPNSKPGPDEETSADGRWIRKVSRPVIQVYLVLVYPVISMDAKITHMDSRKALLGAKPSEAQIRFFSNELHVTRDTPPALILHAADDRLVDVDNTVVFFEALRHAGVSVETRLFQKGQHGFFLMPRDEWMAHVTGQPAPPRLT